MEVPLPPQMPNSVVKYPMLPAAVGQFAKLVSTGTVLAVILPPPLGLRLEPVPMTRAPAVLVPEERLAHELHGEPESTAFPFASHLMQSLVVIEPVELAVFAPFPVKLKGA